MIEILILSIVQGITEFIPVSSSSHLILISNFFNFENSSLSIDISLHIGSFFAILTYFRKEVINSIKNLDLFSKIFYASIPLMLVGFILIKFNIIEQIRSVKVIAWATIIFAIFLYYSDKCKLKKNIDRGFTLKSALIIGIFQILSLIPGVSRSGITISSARLLNFKREDSVKISFLLSIPTLAALSIYGIFDLLKSNSLIFSIANFSSIILSFIFSYITVKYFVKYVRSYNLNIFVIYRIILGLILLSVAYL